MTIRTLLMMAGIAVIAIPAVTPASQPRNVRVTNLTAAEAPEASDIGWMFADPHRTGEFSIILPSGFTTLGAELAG